MENVIPNRSFVREMKIIDRRLGVKFNGEHFVVTYDRGYGDPVNIHRVKAEDGGFRQPARRDLEFIKSGDLENESMKTKLARLASHSYEVRQTMRKRAKEEIRAMTRDNRIQLTNTVLKKSNARKANSAFRRISP